MWRPRLARGDVLAAVHTFFVPVCCCDAGEVLKCAWVFVWNSDMRLSTSGLMALAAVTVVGLAIVASVFPG